MIVVDTSAFIVSARGEPEVAAFRARMLAADQVVMSAGNYLECAMVGAGRGFGGRAMLDEWIADRGIDIVPVDHHLAQLAADAFLQFGKGRHPAGLNYGDCFAYALAKSLRAPLLFKGADFAKTDIEPALS